MPYKKPVGYRTPHQIIESTFDIHKKEAVYTKKKGAFQELKQISKERTKDNTTYNLFSAEDKIHHTHPNKNIKAATPSRADLVSFFNAYNHGVKNNQAISIMDTKTGKEMGRTHFTFTPKTLEVINKEYLKYTYNKGSLERSPETDYIKSLLFDIKLKSKLGIKFDLIKVLSGGLLSANHTFNNKKYISVLEKEFGIKIRFVSMPGYKFNKEKMIFEKEK